MAGHQRHLVELGHVPGADQDAAAVGVGFQGVDDLLDLVDVPAAGRGPAAPLHAIDGAEAAVLGRPFVPDGAAALLQPAHVAVAAQKPQQLQDDAFEVDFFGGDQRKTFGQVKAHLVAEHAFGAGAGAVAFFSTMEIDVAQQVFVLVAHGAGGGEGGCRRHHSPFSLWPACSRGS